MTARRFMAWICLSTPRCLLASHSPGRERRVIADQYSAKVTCPLPSTAPRTSGAPTARSARVLLDRQTNKKLTSGNRRAARGCIEGSVPLDVGGTDDVAPAARVGLDELREVPRRTADRLHVDAGKVGLNVRALEDLVDRRVQLGDD